MIIAIIVLANLALTLSILSIGLHRLDKQMYQETLDIVVQQRDTYKTLADNHHILTVLSGLRYDRRKMRPSGRLSYPVRYYGATVGYVYLISINDEYYKIGYAQKVQDRISDLQVGSPYEIRVLHLISCHYAARLENILHNRYAQRWVTGEWFKLTPEDITEIQRIHSPVTIADLDQLEMI